MSSKLLLLVLAFLAVNLISAEEYDFSSMTPQEIVKLLNGNPVVCYYDIQDALPLLEDFIEVGQDYVNSPKDPHGVLDILNDLLVETTNLQSDCGVAVGPISYRATQYNQQYCVSNIQEMLCIAKKITGEPPLTSSIRNLNLFFNYISYAVNTCGGITDYTDSDNY